LKQLPGCVVMAKSTEEISGILKFANQRQNPVVPRGSGTGLSGGSLPSPDCVVLCVTRWTKSWSWISEPDDPGRSRSHDPGGRGCHGGCGAVLSA